MTLKWKAIWIKKNGCIDQYHGYSKQNAVAVAMSTKDVSWWQVLKAEGDGWRSVQNSLDIPMPKPITLRDVLESEIKMRINCAQDGTAEQLKAIMDGFNHHYAWNGAKHFQELVAYAYLEENQGLQDITGAMAARDMGMTTALDSPILLISSRPAVQAVEGKMSRMQAGSWGNTPVSGHTHPPSGHN